MKKILSILSVLLLLVITVVSCDHSSNDAVIIQGSDGISWQITSTAVDTDIIQSVTVNGVEIKNGSSYNGPKKIDSTKDATIIITGTTEITVICMIGKGSGNNASSSNNLYPSYDGNKATITIPQNDIADLITVAITVSKKIG